MVEPLSMNLRVFTVKVSVKNLVTSPIDCKRLESV